MFVLIYIYTKCIGLTKPEAKELSSNFPQGSFVFTVPSKDPLTLHYSLKYGEKEISWVE